MNKNKINRHEGTITDNLKDILETFPFLNYLFFDIEKTNFYKNKDLPYQNLEFLLDQYIDKDIYIPNLMRTINISIKEDSYFNYRHYSPELSVKPLPSCGGYNESEKLDNKL